MPSPDTPLTPVTLTNEQVLAILLDATGDLDTAEVLQERIPSWLLKASAARIAALMQAASELRASQLKVEVGLSHLRPLEAFCASALTHALRLRWPVTFEVEHDGLVLKGDHPGTRTLLDAAMQNFTVEEAGSDGLPKGSEIQLKNHPQGVAGLTPSAFAGLCRDLNLGQRYQEHFAQMFGLQERAGRTEVTSALGPDIVRLKKRLLAFDMHLASMKGDITQEGHQMLQRLIDAEGAGDAKALHYAGRPLLMQGLGGQDICFWGVVVFSRRPVEEHPDEWCLVYMPGEPYRPLFEYPAFSTFKLYLTLKLGLRSYAAPFARYLDEDSKADFFQTFARTRQLGTLQARPIARSLFDFMLHSHVGKLQIDARVLAVPTADVDAEASRERWLGYLDTGVTIAGLAGFFLPVVGELMMGVAVGQLLAEVYEGIEDWGSGDRHDALAHMLGVAENVALMAATAGVAKSLGGVVSRSLARHPEFFGRFAAVFDRAGRSRLWMQSLQGYEQPAATEAPTQVDYSGLYQARDRTFLQIEDKHYAVTLDPDSKTWRILHPTRKTAFAPEPLPNGEGGWLRPGEQVERWRDSAYVLKRMNPRLSGIDDRQLGMICRLTDTPLDELHRLAQDSTPLPLRLQDMAKRFELDGKLRRFIADMEQGNAGAPLHAQEQLQALPMLKGWPHGRYIEVLDDEANVMATYPPTAVSDPDLCVHVTQTQLAAGQLLQTVVGGLYPEEAQTLIGAPAIGAGQDTQLAKRLGAELKAGRRPLFEQLYRLYDSGGASDVKKACEAFPGLPERCARQLIDLAPSVERQHLQATGRLPMGLAQRMRRIRDAVRMDRALAGFHLPELADDDTQRLGIRLLAHLDGWQADWRLELRERTFPGPLLEAIGHPGAALAETCTIVKSSAGFEVFKGNRSLGRVLPGPESLYAAVLKGMPASWRSTTGFAEQRPGDAARLRARLLETALDGRFDAERALINDLPLPVRKGVACVQGDSPVGSPKHADALRRKVKRLYPLFSDAQANALLDGLGPDRLTRARAVRQLEQALKDLTTRLERWSEDGEALQAMGGELREARQSRRQAARLIIEAWRRKTRMADGHCSLRLDDMRIGKLPHLPANASFDHVRHVSLKNMQLTDDGVYFLKAFQNAESLDLDGNQLTRLPEVISHMPALTRLSLSDNRVQLTEQTLAKLSGLRSLHSLNLSGNALGATPDVGKMFDLRFLSLRNTRATELPKGVSRLPNLDRVDLRDNDIRQLPNWLFQAPRRMSETVNLRHNPLQDPSRGLLLAYRDRVGVGMGFFEDDITRLSERQAKELWFTDRAGQMFEQRNRVWTAFKEDSRAGGLFHLLSELGNTADSEFVHQDMARRVWRVLQAAEGDAVLCEQVLDLAANPIRCTDSAALNFSHLEVAVEVHQILHRQTNAEASAADLLRLGQRLFRLEQVDQIVQAHIDSHPRVDALEVGLAYRTGLAEALDLPGQPRHMRFEFLSGVTDDDLKGALLKVKNAELSTRFPTYLAQQPFWCDLMRQHHPRQFSSTEAIYPPRLQALFEKADTLTDSDYLEQVSAISLERQTAETNLMKRLTDDVIKRIELGVCALSDF
ncbi:NEL-type E3 ubiquitin ligase domain-containing protein [Pseudomonas sp. R16(2017)]|uniref:NEL-type E3 ubiquitin ligase domain-containing protein n=1 Tax=Pseudomonas sp. R16(2017) TaxID=1981704 RepID=UPI000A1F160C|nr:NEL-type E3 ubiquitin ligase domain-containing protein [Pseudomonas sp. R16(2017)]